MEYNITLVLCKGRAILNVKCGQVLFDHKFQGMCVCNDQLSDISVLAALHSVYTDHWMHIKLLQVHVSV